MENVVSANLYDHLSFKDQPGYTDGLDKYLQEATAEFEKGKPYQEAGILPPVIQTGYTSLLFVRGLPVAPKDKEAMVKALLTTKILPPALKSNLVEVELEINETTNMTTGSAILAFDSPENCSLAQEAIDRLELAKLVLSATVLDVVDDVLNTETQLKPTNHLQDKELLDFLDDKFCREQLAVRISEKNSIVTNNRVNIFWNNDIEGFLTDYTVLNDETTPDGDFQCERIEFSNTGKYLACYTSHGIVLYGGATMQTIAFYKHSKVAEIKFSPDDSYLCTFSGIAGEKGKTSENMIVWNVKTASKIKTFVCPKKSVFELFSWSFDEKYCATIIDTAQKPVLYVYESENMTLIPDEIKENDKWIKRKRPLPFENPRTFKWANKRSTLLFVCYPYDINSTTKPQVGCIDIPSRIEYKWMDLNFIINTTQIKWEENDRFVSVYFSTTFKKEVEHMIHVGVLPKPSPSALQKNFIQVKTLNFKDKDKDSVKEFGFDQSGKNFWLTYPTKQNKTNFDYYSINFDKIITITKEDSVENFEFTSAVFSNIENLCLFVTKGSIAFVQLKNSTEKFKLKQTGEIKQISVGGNVTINYDNTGRNVMIVDKAMQRVSIYSAYGQLKTSKDFTNMAECVWRKIKRVPIADSVVSQLYKDLKKEVIEAYQVEDKKRIEDYQTKHSIEKDKKTEAFMKYFKTGLKRWEDTKPQRVKLLGYDPDVIEDPIYLEFIDKKEEYDLIVLPK